MTILEGVKVLLDSPAVDEEMKNSVRECQACPFVNECDGLVDTLISYGLLPVSSGFHPTVPTLAELEKALEDLPN